MSRICEHQKVLSTYDTILFDLDGTLYDSDQFYRGVFEDMAQWLVQAGFQKNPEPWVDCIMGLKQARGNDYASLIDDALLLLGIEGIVKTKLLHLYQNHDCRNLVLGPEESGCLAYLKSCPKNMCIITNGQKQLQTRKIDRLGLAPYMKEILILDPSAMARLKPDAAAFDLLCSRFKPGKTIMVGDRFDIDGVFAKNAGIDFMGVGFYGN